MKLSNKDSKTIVSNKMVDKRSVLFLQITNEDNKIKVILVKETNVSKVTKRDLDKLIAYSQ